MNTMFPKSFFSKDIKVNLGECCVLMPYAKEFDNVYEAIRSAVEGGQVCFHCSRADDFRQGGSVMGDILELIGRAEIIIADLTDNNPNVFYELGIAHTARGAEKAILIKQGRLENVPFDVRHLRIIDYYPDGDGLEKLKSQLVSAFAEVGEYSWQFSVDDGRSYKKGQKIFGLDGQYNYTFGLSRVEVGQGGATFQLAVCRVEDGKEIELPEQDRNGLQEGSQIVIPGLGWELNLIKADGRTAKFGVGRRTPGQEAS